MKIVDIKYTTTDGVMKSTTLTCVDRCYEVYSHNSRELILQVSAEIEDTIMEELMRGTTDSILLKEPIEDGYNEKLIDNYSHIKTISKEYDNLLNDKYVIYYHVSFEAE